MNVAVVAFFFLILFQACHQSNRDDAVVQVRLLNCKGKDCERVILYKYREPFSLIHLKKEPVDTFTADRSGRLRFTIQADQLPCLIDLGGSSYVFSRDIYISRGDRLKLVFDHAYDPPSLVSRTESGRYNSFLQTFADTFYRNPEVRNDYYNGSNFLLVPDYAKYIDKRHQQQLQFAEEILNDPGADSLFKKFLLHEINYQWANDKTAFLWKKWIRNEEVPLPGEYFDFLNQLDLHDPDAWKSPAYQRFLELYVRELHRQLPVSSQTGTYTARVKADLASRIFSGTTLKIALWQILQEESSNSQSLTGFDSIRAKKTEDLATYMFEQTLDSAYLYGVKNIR